MRGRPPRAGRAAGGSLLEALAVTALLGLFASLATLELRRQVARQAALASAESFASELKTLRARAIARARGQGLLLERGEGDWPVSIYEDGDGDGFGGDDRRSGRDRRVAGPQAFRARFAGAQPGFLPELVELRSPPPRSRRLGALDDPARFGRGDLLAFSPRGSSSSGTLYLSDGRERQFAVVLNGAHGRVRVWEWLPAEDRWQRR